ncbi:MAG: SMC-Scp complex subunit ScpB [Candidatus Solibacter sp.]|nr:SMC-Scp complex subunit ScpB [Candidatus Solibacter sp.]
MAENEIPAAGEAPETDENHEPANGVSASGDGAQSSITANEEGGSGGQAVQMEMDAADLLGGAEQPATAPDAQAAELKAVLEAVVYVMNEPMPAGQIAEALGRDKKEVEEALRQLVEDSAQPGRGLLIREVAGGYQMATKPEHHEAIRTFVKNLKQPLKLSQAALETLAVIAYKQPITLPEILEIRGVQGGGVLKTLIDRKLVTTAGRKQVIGRPMLYKTTKDFLTQFGLKDVNELPSLKEFEEIRRQSMADEEFAAEPQQNEIQPGGPAAAVDALLDAGGTAESVEETPPNEIPAVDETKEVIEINELIGEEVAQAGEPESKETAKTKNGEPGGEEGPNG